MATFNYVYKTQQKIEAMRSKETYTLIFITVKKNNY